MFPEKLHKHYHPHYKNTDHFQSFQLSRVFIHDHYTRGMHQHDFYEVGVICNGSGIHYINGEQIPIKQGDVFVILPNVEHGYKGDDDFAIAHINFSDAFLKKHISDFSSIPAFFTLFFAEPRLRGHSKLPLHLMLNKGQFELLSPVLVEAARYRFAATQYEALVSDNLAAAALTLLCQFYENKFAQPKSDDYDSYFLKALSHIHKNYNTKITIADLAKIANLSRSSFINRFNVICKTPPIEYINNLRLETAKDLLTSSQLSLTEIASRTGFHDVSYFSRMFRLKCGVTPGEYRKGKKPS